MSEKMSFYMNLSVSQDDTADNVRQTTPGNTIENQSKNKVSDAEKARQASQD